MRLHGVHHRELRKEGVDARASHGWLRDGNLRPTTEALVVAAQDQVIHTMAYKAKILRQPVNPVCRACGEGEETIAHILAWCPAYRWGLRKQRHDRVLFQLVVAVAKELGLQVPRALRTKNGGIQSGVFGTRGETLIVDRPTPTDRATEVNKPDLIVSLEQLKRIVVMEVAVAWEPLVQEREKEKETKYQELAADLAHAWEGFGCWLCRW